MLKYISSFVNKISNVKRLLKNNLLPQYYWYSRLRSRLRAKLISDERYVLSKYKRIHGELPDLRNPQTYNENITKILLTPPNDLTVQCVDKYEVRSYVEKSIGMQVLNNLIGVYYSFKELEKDFLNYPDKFVLKATHGSGWNFICRNKKSVDITKLKILINHWLKSNFYHAQRELIYKKLKPRIICESYLEDESGGLVDYKVHCFRGIPKIINVIHNRKERMILNTYDINWNYLNISFSRYYPPDPGLIIEKPKSLDQVLKISRILSEPFRYVRVDFYIVKEMIYFGELTFTPGNGAYTFTKDQDVFLGHYFE